MGKVKHKRIFEGASMPLVVVYSVII